MVARFDERAQLGEGRRGVEEGDEERLAGGAALLRADRGRVGCPEGVSGGQRDRRLRRGSEVEGASEPGPAAGKEPEREVRVLAAARIIPIR